MFAGFCLILLMTHELRGEGLAHPFYSLPWLYDASVLGNAIHPV